MRRITSILLLVLFLVLSVSGLQMTLPKDKSFFSTQQTQSSHEGAQENGMMPKKNFYPKEMHEWAGILFIGAGLVHIGLNRKSIWFYLKNGRN